MEKAEIEMGLREAKRLEVVVQAEAGAVSCKEGARRLGEAVRQAISARYKQTAGFAKAQVNTR